jgi:hypothetical protein
MKKKTNEASLQRYRDIITSAVPTTVEEFEEKDTFIAKMNSSRAKLHDFPPPAQVLQLIPDYQKESIKLAVKNGFKIPQYDELHHEYIASHFCEASPQNKERPCAKLSCEAFQSFGFRPREFLIPSIQMGNVAGYCYICHIHFATLYTLNIVTEFPVHMFSVKTNSPGEYKSSICLPKERRDGIATGLYGNLPFYSAENYKVKEKPNGLKYLEENPHLIVNEGV